MANWIDETISALPEALTLVLAVAIAVVVSGLQYAVGYEITLAPLLLIPVAIPAWRLAGRYVLVVALLCAAGGLPTALYGRNDWSPAVHLWNAGARLMVLFLTGYLVYQLRIRLQDARSASRLDFLTGIENSRAFELAIQTEMLRSRRSHRPFTLAFIDVDNFKRVNDRAGHHEGDRLLYVVAQTLRECMREIDTVARIGGDEFAMLLVETDAAGAGVALERVMAALRYLPFPVTFSIGAVTFNVPPASTAELTRAADEAMYAAKRAGKDAIRHRIVDAPLSSDSRAAGKRRMPRPHPSRCRVGST